jgi:hypothetical protein
LWRTRRRILGGVEEDSQATAIEQARCAIDAGALGWAGRILQFSEGGARKITW